MDRDANDSPLNRPHRQDDTMNGGGDARRMQAIEREGNEADRGVDQQAVRETRGATPAVHRETDRAGGMSGDRGGMGGSDAMEGAGRTQEEVGRKLERSRESSSGKEPSPDLGSGGMGSGGTRGA